MLRDTVIHGTPDDIAAQIAAFVDAGARHVQLTNMTPLAAPGLAAASEALLADAVVRPADRERRAGVTRPPRRRSALAAAALARSRRAPPALGASRTRHRGGVVPRALAFSGRAPAVDRGRDGARGPAAHPRVAAPAR